MTLEKTARQIRKFQSVNSWLYRGGQPSDEQFEQLAALGIKTVVSLRSGKVRAQLERRLVERLGMCFEHFPFTYFGIPQGEEIDRFLRLLDDQSTHPIFVHCLHGVDRTGYMIALYRIKRMKWPLAEAYNEMKSLGFHAFRLPHFKWELTRYASWAQAQGNNDDQLPVKLRAKS